MSSNPIRNTVSNYGAVGSNNEVQFSSNNPEITAICNSVTTNIYTINECVKKLKDAVKIIGTDRDSKGFRDQVHVWQISTNQVVIIVKKYFVTLTMLGKTANKEQKLQIEKLTNHFKESVMSYGVVQKNVADKLKSHLLKSNIGEQSDNDTALLLEEEEENIRKLRQEQKFLEFEQGMLLDRENQIKSIENDILDINQIMKEMAGLVHEQGYMIDSIENNIETVHQNVEDGSQQLEQAARYQRKSRNRKIILAVIAAVILITLIITIVTSFR